MQLEAILVTVLMSAALLWLAASLRRGRRLALPAVVLASGLAVWAATSTRSTLDPAGEADTPFQANSGGYVSSRACRACHPDNYASWHDSYHRSMTQFPSPETIAADFDDIELQLDGKKTRLERVGEEYWVELEDPDSLGSDGRPPRIRRRIALVTGSHHMQMYWYETGEGRKLGQVGLAYLIDEKRWIPRRAAFIIPRWAWSDAETGRWNSGCIECHTTRGQPRNQDMDTRMVEAGIACESCHGPGAEHVARHHDPQDRYELHLSDGADPTVVNPARLTPERSAQVCGQCHANAMSNPTNTRDFYETGHKFEPGDDLAETKLVIRKKFAPGRLREFMLSEPDPAARPPSVRALRDEIRRIYPLDNNYWPDGVIRTSGSEYNGLVESPCFQHGPMSCSSCHTMHKREDDTRTAKEWANDQLGLGMDGNQACLQCHEAFADRVAEHTNHAPDSAGSLCYNCHMSFTTWGLLKAMRSHTIESPSVATSVNTGRPNACNQCHLDETLDWTAAALERWYGTPRPELDAEQATVAASLLWLLRGDAGQRALMAWNMGWEDARRVSGSDWIAPYLVQLLADPYDAVRIAAYRSLRSLPGFTDFEYDLLAPAQELQSARARGVERWESAEVALQPSAPLLVDERGGIRWDELNRILEKRDNRPVNLAE